MTGLILRVDQTRHTVKTIGLSPSGGPGGGTRALALPALFPRVLFFAQEPPHTLHQGHLEHSLPDACTILEGSGNFRR